LPNAAAGEGESPLFGFFSLQRLLIEGSLLVRSKAAGLRTSSRFSVCLRSCGFGRHSSSSAADVVRAGDRGTELSIMRHRPLSRWRSAIGSVWPRSGRSIARSCKGSRSIDNAPGIWLTLRSLVPARQASRRSSRCSNPACSLDERPPRRIFCGGSIAKSASDLFASRSIKGRSFRLPGSAPTRSQAHPMTDLRDRIVHAALGFSCFRFSGRRNRRDFQSF